MRTLIDIPDEKLQQLTRLSRERRVSRAEVVRCAIDQYLAAQPKSSLRDLFGIWSDRNIDGLAYEQELRREWDREL